MAVPGGAGGWSGLGSVGVGPAGGGAPDRGSALTRPEDAGSVEGWPETLFPNINPEGAPMGRTDLDARKTALRYLNDFDAALNPYNPDLFDHVIEQIKQDGHSPGEFLAGITRHGVRRLLERRGRAGITELAELIAAGPTPPTAALAAAPATAFDMNIVHPYPAESPRRRRLADDPIRVGRYGTGQSPVEIDLRHNNLLVTGIRRSGMTTFLRSVLAELVQYEDTLTWVMNLNSDCAEDPLVESYLKGHAPQPAIDWVADTPAEIDSMAAELGRIAQARQDDPECRAARIKAADGLLPLSPDRPGIVLVVSGDRADGYTSIGLDETLTRIQRSGGLATGNGITTVCAVTRPVSAIISPTLRKEFGAVAALCPTDQRELAIAFGEAGIFLESATVLTPGSGFVRPHRRAEPAKFRTYLPDYDDMGTLACTVSTWRPTGAVEAIGNEAYATRWERRLAP